MKGRRMVPLLLLLGQLVAALEVPLDLQEGLPQPPTITSQSPKDHIIDPRENIEIKCEAKGNPDPSFSWTRDGAHFKIEEHPNVNMRPNSGTLEVDITKRRAESFEGVYQCTAENKHGKAVSDNIVVRQSRSPLWSKERLKPRVVQEGVSLVLPCEPPAGLPPPLIFWMDNNFQKLPQSTRVSQSLNGDLYFSNVRREDSRNDYICYARFPGTQTIQQKQPITVKVLNLDSINDTMAAFYNDTDLFSEAPADERMPSFLIPKDRHSSKVVLRGHKLDMECIAEGRPTPEISWTKDGSVLPAGRTSFLQFNKTLQIDDVSDSEEGVYRCTATNKFGSVHHTFHVTVKAAPYWISGPPSNLVLSPGENGMLTCRASGKPKPLIRWTKNVMPIETGLEDDTMKVEDDMIIFRDVKTSNSAVYQCNVSNEFGYLLANAFVNVLSEPPRVLTPVNKKYEVIRNHRAMLDCSFFGSPIPNITWFKDSRSSTLDGDSYALHDNGTLEIRISRPRDSGKYTCVARNILGIFENHVFLEVKEPTHFLKQPEYQVIKRGRSVTFECKVKHDSSLTATMTWLKDDEELPDDDRFVVGAESLTITNVVDSDAGMYTCIMNTTLDHVSASAELTVVDTTPAPAVVDERPDPPTDLELTDQTKRSVVLTWIPGNEYNSHIKNFLIQYEDSLHHRGHWHNLTHVPGTKTSAHLKLSPHVHYTFRVLALNDVGWSQPSNPSQMYKTDPAAPDENPTGVQGLGTEPNNLIISWKPLTKLQSNGPGLHYKVMYREKKPGSEWITTNVANNSRFVVSGTSTFAPYELKVQAVNNYGEGPEPAVVIGYSGEDVPKSAPTGLRTVVRNSTMAEVGWKTVSDDSIRGFLKGYKVHYWRDHGVHRHHLDHVEKILTFSGNRSHGILPGLHPFSDYSFYVKVFNGRGEGPPSITKHFRTPEGVPGPPTSLVVSNPNLDSLTLKWSPPYDPNGHITGYTLKYQPGQSQTSHPKVWSRTVHPPLKERPASPFANVSSSVGDDGALISWEYWGSEKNVYVEYIANNSESEEEWQKELVNGSQNVKLKGLKGGLSYRVRVVAYGHHDQPLHSSDELVVTVPAMVSRQVDIATQGWFIGLMCAIALLILILLIICFIQRNKGGKYPVKEKEDAHTDPEFQPMRDDDCPFGEYSDSEDHKPLKGSRTPSNGTVKRDDSDDSLVDYSEGGDRQFNEDGSFIGQYSGKSISRETAEGPQSSEAPSPINAINSLNSFV
ncbi:neuronal cell adhesion molecule isoform X9 [Oryzias latipes]|uniref:Neural cell adhesion molecule L1 n=1 Tax=Oryzias latipes TaxID=8090 RepID=A0A3B3HEN9_ORYLA|nr:neuronal cell adhesion molecule isoform X9 [Oryzias latipes]